MATDKLNVSQFAEMAGMDESFIRSHPYILGLVRQAIKEDWLASPQGKANFQREFEKSPWFRQNASWARGYLLAEAQGGEDFKQKRETVGELIAQRAMNMGAALSEDALAALTTAYFMNGWGEQGRESMLDKALTGQLEDFDISYLDFKRGGPDAIVTQLKANARANGLSYTEDYFRNAATQVLGGTRSLNDMLAAQRQLAATSNPWAKDRVLAGENLRDIASPYIATYAKMFGLNAGAVELDDPNLKVAFNATDAKGNPVPMGLWDYEKALRKTDGWAYTKDAHDKVSSLTGDILRMFGFGG